MQVVVLDHIGIGCGHGSDQPPDQVRLRRIAGASGLEHLLESRWMAHGNQEDPASFRVEPGGLEIELHAVQLIEGQVDRKSTRLNSSHGYISYAVFCLKKKKKKQKQMKEQHDHRHRIAED